MQKLGRPARSLSELKDLFLDWFMPEPTSGCWLWLRGVHNTGYGQATVNNKSVTAHRLSWVLQNGDIPGGLCVLHKCDVRLCVNPGHLFLGTHQDNTDDKMVKGRWRGGKTIKTHCIRGHAFTPENSYRCPRGLQNYCRECKRLEKRARRANQKEFAKLL